MDLRPYLFLYQHTSSGLLPNLWTGTKRSVRYLMETEVHVYGFSIAANVLLSFFPFMIVMVSLARYFVGRHAEEAIYLALRDYLPGIMGVYIPRHIKGLVDQRGALQWASVGLLFFTANGIFEPLEVALNRAFGIRKNRSFVRNQVVSMGLIFACGSLMLVSAIFAGFGYQWTREIFGRVGWWSGIVTAFIIKLAAIPTTILALFLTYWLLPNGPVTVRRVLPAAIGVGLLLEVFKYLVMASWPWFGAKLYREYGPFYASASIIIWSFLGSMIVLAGAEWAGRERAPCVDRQDWAEEAGSV